MSIWIWCEDCKGKFEAKPSSLKIEDLGGGSFRLTAKCPNCSVKSMARYVPSRPDAPAIIPPPPGSPFAQTVAGILREEGCMAGEDGPTDPIPPRSAPFVPRLVK